MEWMVGVWCNLDGICKVMVWLLVCGDNFFLFLELIGFIVFFGFGFFLNREFFNFIFFLRKLYLFCIFWGLSLVLG